MPTKNYSDMTVDELEKKAKDAGISGYSGMKKDELVQALEKQLPKSSGKSSNGKMPGILAVLKQEHDEVKELFDEFEKQVEKDVAEASATVTMIMEELVRHAEMEEQIVYPALQRADEDIYHEAHEEHHVAELLIGEIQGMQPDGAWKAKVMVLGENVKHHIEEEESEAFKTLRKLPNNELEQMATQWSETKSSWTMKAS